MPTVPVWTLGAGRRQMDSRPRTLRRLVRLARRTSSRLMGRPSSSAVRGWANRLMGAPGRRPRRRCSAVEAAAVVKVLAPKARLHPKQFSVGSVDTVATFRVAAVQHRPLPSACKCQLPRELSRPASLAYTARLRRWRRRGWASARAGSPTWRNRSPLGWRPARRRDLADKPFRRTRCKRWRRGRRKPRRAHRR